VGGVTFTDSSNGGGLMNLNSATGYTGFTLIGNGGSNVSKVNIGNGGSLGAGAGTIITNNGVLSGAATGQTTTVTQSTTHGFAGKLTLQSGGTLMPGNIGLVNIQGRGLDTGFIGNQSSNVSTNGNNVMNASNLTWYAGGTIKFTLDSTAQYGTALNPSASTLLNLGTGGFAKGGGVGQYVLDFQGTGGWNTSGNNNGDPGNAYTNVYDLINFGTINNYGVITGDTTFSINDFTIKNLAGVGTLSFYYNPNADGGLGQEELLLTVVPEPSTWAMLLGGLVALVFWTRKRSRRPVFTKTK
jgi:hypothetical protein